MEYSELKLKTDHDIRALLSEERERLRGLRFRASEGQLSTVRDIRKSRTLVARIMTDIARRKNSAAALA